MPQGSALFMAFADYGPVKTRNGKSPLLAVQFPDVLSNDTVPACAPVPPPKFQGA